MVGELQAYVLGGEQHEIARLDAQAAFYESASSQLLQAAGIAPGMRVLDLGTGLGHVARLVASLVGPDGEVVGVDAQPGLLAIARERTAEAGFANVRFVDGDVRTYREDRPLDAVVGRLILFHLADPATVVRHHAERLERGGVFVAIDFDVVACRTEPTVALAQTTLDFLLTSFRGAGADPSIGSRLASILASAGLADVSGYGIQSYIPPGNPHGPALLAGVVRTLAAATGGAGLPPELEPPDTLEQRLAAELQAADATLLPPTLVGAWART